MELVGVWRPIAPYIDAPWAKWVDEDFSVVGGRYTTGNSTNEFYDASAGNAAAVASGDGYHRWYSVGSAGYNGNVGGFDAYNTITKAADRSPICAAIEIGSILNGGSLGDFSYVNTAVALYTNAPNHYGVRAQIEWKTKTFYLAEKDASSDVVLDGVADSTLSAPCGLAITLFGPFATLWYRPGAPNAGGKWRRITCKKSAKFNGQLRTTISSFNHGVYIGSSHAISSSAPILLTSKTYALALGEGYREVQGQIDKFGDVMTVPDGREIVIMDAVGAHTIDDFSDPDGHMIGAAAHAIVTLRDNYTGQHEIVGSHTLADPTYAAVINQPAMSYDPILRDWHYWYYRWASWNFESTIRPYYVRLRQDPLRGLQSIPVGTLVIMPAGIGNNPFYDWWCYYDVNYGRWVAIGTMSNPAWEDHIPIVISGSAPNNFDTIEGIDESTSAEGARGMKTSDGLYLLCGQSAEGSSDVWRYKVTLGTGNQSGLSDKATISALSDLAGNHFAQQPGHTPWAEIDGKTTHLFSIHAGAPSGGLSVQGAAALYRATLRDTGFVRSRRVYSGITNGYDQAEKTQRRLTQYIGMTA